MLFFSHIFMELSTILLLLALFKLIVWITFAAAKPSASCRTNTGISSLNRSCQDHLLTPSKPHFERMYCLINVDSCSYMIISGYWVGPDIDDGWGYVEAFVNPITWPFSSIPLVFFPSPFGNRLCFCCLALMDIKCGRNEVIISCLNGVASDYFLGLCERFHRSIQGTLFMCSQPLG